jgi:hypothetical protein
MYEPKTKIREPLLKEHIGKRIHLYCVRPRQQHSGILTNFENTVDIRGNESVKLYFDGSPLPILVDWKTDYFVLDWAERLKRAILGNSTA